jgi:lipopolysaccharide export system permease protein
LFYDVFYRSSLGPSLEKGGLGLPIIFAVNFLSTSSTLSEENSTGKWNVSFYGAWMSSLSCHQAILLTYRATNDIGLINMDVILSPFQKLFQNYFHLKNKYLS